MPKLDLRSALRIKLPTTGQISQMKGVGFAWPDAAPAADGPAAWFTPSTGLVVTGASPVQYYRATLAWSHRYEVNQLDYPRATNRMIMADHGWIDLQGDNDDAGLNMLGSVEPWGWVPNASWTWPSGGFVEPDETANYVLLWDQAGGLSSGHYAQLWRNGTLVGYVTTQIPDYGISNMRVVGDASTPLAGETQGFWFAGDTAMDPATMFAELFDGANGMLDLADPTIDGTSPDSYQFGP
jgi:hypothetical protein